MSPMTWHGRKVEAAVKEAAARGLKQWADDVLKASQPEVPVAAVGGGFTRDSGKVEVDAGALQAAVSYDSPPGTHLAIWVHENMRNQHLVGKSKFLEDPLNASKASGPKTVAAEIKKAT